MADGTYINVGAYSVPEFADLDNDGDLDLYVGEEDGNINVFINNGNGNFSMAENLQADGYYIDVETYSAPAFADISGNCLPTLFVGDYQGKIEVYIGNDATPPVITSTHNDQTIGNGTECDVSLPDYTGDVIASDNCDPNLDITQTPVAGTIISGITNTVTLRATDDVGDFDEVTFNVEVADNINPTITSTHNNQQIDADANCETSLPDYTVDVTATDNCDTNLDITQNPIAGTSISGATNTVTLTVTDDAGNTDEVTFNVEVVDNTNPVITSTHNDQSIGDGAECDVSLPDYTTEVVATDNCDQNLDVTQYPVAGTLVSGAINTVTLTVTDDAGNTDEVTFNVEVVDNTNPVITSTHNDQSMGDGVECDVNLPDYTTEVVATDNCDPNLDITQYPVAGTSISGAINTVTLTVTDDAGNTDEVTFNVEVADNIPPVITSIHNDQQIDADANCETNLPDYTGDVTATDNCDANLDIIQNPVAGTIISGITNTVTLTVTDDAGNTDEVSFNAEVVDNTAPEIVCIPDAVRIANELGNYTIFNTEFDPVIVNDNCQLSYVTNNYNSSNTLAGEVLVEGIYTFFWTAEDISGNQVYCSFNVTIDKYAGIETLENNDISIYPNPTKRWINLEFTNDNFQNITILDVTGKQLIQKTTINKKEIIDLSNYANGIYILKIQTDNEVLTTKIVKE